MSEKNCEEQVLGQGPLDLQQMHSLKSKWCASRGKEHQLEAEGISTVWGRMQ
jgi:hypothetical protein